MLFGFSVGSPVYGIFVPGVAGVGDVDVSGEPDSGGVVEVISAGGALGLAVLDSTKGAQSIGAAVVVVAVGGEVGGDVVVEAALGGGHNSASEELVLLGGGVGVGCATANEGVVHSSRAASPAAYIGVRARWDRFI